MESGINVEVLGQEGTFQGSQQILWQQEKKSWWHLEMLIIFLLGWSHQFCFELLLYITLNILPDDMLVLKQ